MRPEQTHWRTVQQVSVWAVPDHPMQPHYQENRGTNLAKEPGEVLSVLSFKDMALTGSLASFLSDIGEKSKQKKPKERSAFLQVQSRSRNL